MKKWPAFSETTVPLHYKVWQDLPGYVTHTTTTTPPHPQPPPPSPPPKKKKWSARFIVTSYFVVMTPIRRSQGGAFLFWGVLVCGVQNSRGPGESNSWSINQFAGLESNNQLQNGASEGRSEEREVNNCHTSQCGDSLTGKLKFHWLSE